MLVTHTFNHSSINTNTKQTLFCSMNPSINIASPICHTPLFNHSLSQSTHSCVVNQPLNRGHIKHAYTNHQTSTNTNSITQPTTIQLLHHSINNHNILVMQLILNQHVRTHHTSLSHQPTLIHSCHQSTIHSFITHSLITPPLNHSIHTFHPYNNQPFTN